MSHSQSSRYLSVLAGILLLLAGCAPKEQEPIVATVGGKPVTLKEYEDLYIKSSGTRDAAAKSTQDEREKFLDLVTKFRLKLTDAYNQGLNKKPELLAEIDQYKSSLASSFLTDREINTPGAKMMYDRRKNEYRASHILISLSQTPSRDDSIAAYAKADTVISRLNAGERFDSVAAHYSQDPSVSQNNGDLYYFTAGQMVPPFEDAVFRMNVGETTQKPVRTQFGLHIIRLTDKKPMRGEIKASHIMLRFDRQDPSPEDTLAAYEKTTAIRDTLRIGSDSLKKAYDSMKPGRDLLTEYDRLKREYETSRRSHSDFEKRVGVVRTTSDPLKTDSLRAMELRMKVLGDSLSKYDGLDMEHLRMRNTPLEAEYERLKVLYDFSELAKRNSGDPGSASKGGDLGWFQRRRWIQSFDEVVQNLKPGENSGIVRTIYGYHLIRCYDEHSPKTFDEAKKDMQQMYQQTRFQDDYKAYFAKLQTSTQYKLHGEILREFIALLDSNKTTKDSAWWSTVPQSVGSAALITFGMRAVTVDSIVKLINARPDFNNTPLRDPGIRNMVDKIGESLVFAVRAETLEKDYPEFGAIMKEYTDGIMLYQIEQDRVWNGVVVNDSLLRLYFQSNRDKFRFPDRVDFTEVRAMDDSVARLLFAQTNAGKTLEEVAAADSARMAVKSNFQVEFPKNSAKLTPVLIKALAPIVDQLVDDAALKVQLTSHPDTSAKKAQNEKLAEQRITTIKDYIKKRGIAEQRVSTITQPYNRKTTTDASIEADAKIVRINTDLIGRRPMVVGKVETAILPDTTDERTMKAASLQLGEVSAPFKSRYGVSIVRLNKRDPARQKTFEEAGTEVSSSFQEYESKRLEKEWIDGLRTQYPVVEYKETLNTAFAPEK